MEFPKGGTTTPPPTAGRGGELKSLDEADCEIWADDKYLDSQLLVGTNYSVNPIT